MKTLQSPKFIVILIILGIGGLIFSASSFVIHKESSTAAINDTEKEPSVRDASESLVFDYRYYILRDPILQEKLIVAEDQTTNASTIRWKDKKYKIPQGEMIWSFANGKVLTKIINEEQNTQTFSLYDLSNSFEKISADTVESTIINVSYLPGGYWLVSDYFEGYGTNVILFDENKRTVFKYPEDQNTNEPFYNLNFSVTRDSILLLFDRLNSSNQNYTEGFLFNIRSLASEKIRFTLLNKNALVKKVYSLNDEFWLYLDDFRLVSIDKNGSVKWERPIVLPLFFKGIDILHFSNEDAIVFLRASVSEVDKPTFSIVNLKTGKDTIITTENEIRRIYREIGLQPPNDHIRIQPIDFFAEDSSLIHVIYGSFEYASEGINHHISNAVYVILDVKNFKIKTAQPINFDKSSNLLYFSMEKGTLIINSENSKMPATK